MKKTRKTIGLLVDYLEMSYSGKIVQGCIEAAKKRDVNLVVYPGTSINYHHTYSDVDAVPERFSNQDLFQRTIVYEYAKRDCIDGLIMPIVTIGTCMSDAEKAEFIQSFGVPVMVLEQKREDVSNLVFEQNGMEITLRHLVEECGCKNIAYISGPLNNDDAIYRFHEFKEVMERYGLPLPPEWIVYGDFTPFCQDVIEKMFADNYKELDAICVANDAMCTALYHVMEKYQVIPGKDILVTGYDNSDIALECEPHLTTVMADIMTMSEYAVNALLDVIDGGPLVSDTIPIKLMKRGSTGWKEDCSGDEIREYSDGVHNHDSMKHVFINSIGTDMLNQAGNFKGSMNCLSYNLKQAGFRECYLYLQEEAFTQMADTGWNLPNRHTEQIYYNLDLGIDRVGDDNKTDLSVLLSSILSDGEQHTLVCYPVRLGEEHYGIFYLGYDISFNMDIYSVANQVATALHISSLMKQLARATEAKSNFLANMSHEIRTPINAVLGMDEMILRESKNQQITEYATDIQSAGRTLLSLVNDILDISKIESGKMELVNTEYELRELIHDVINLISIKAEEKNLYLQLNVDSDIPSVLYGDDVRIRQILVNLLNNAVKYTNEGGVTLNVSLVQIDGDNVVIRYEVKDTGIGIRQQDIAKLFSQFERIEEKRNRHVEGTGLGMNIATRFLDIMNSKLDVDSVYGKGSTFSFELCQRIVNNKPVGDVKAQKIQKSVDYKYEASFFANNARVLVVDDNAVNRKLFASLLKQTGLIIDSAASGQECISLVSKKEYDVIFMDHMMPEMDGIETLANMRQMKNNQSANAKVVALTANAISGAREQYLLAGFDEYLTKPIVADKLEQLLVSLLPKEKVTLKESSRNNMQDVNRDNMFECLSKMPEFHLDYARLYVPDDDFLKDCIIEFYRVMEKEALDLQTFYRDYLKAVAMGEYETKLKVLKEYAVKVHGMKSSSNIVGAVNLSGMAYTLEQAAYEEDHDTIVALTNVFLKSWMELHGKLRECKKNHLEQQMATMQELQETTDTTKMSEDDEYDIRKIMAEIINENKEKYGDLEAESRNESKSRILVVDDNIINLKHARSILQEHFDGYYVSSGKDALTLLSGRRVDLILLDIHMPDMDGFAVMEELKKDERLSQIPVIMLTADSNHDAELKGFRNGAMDFITKPFVSEIMLQRVQRIIEFDRLRKNLSNEVAIKTKVSENRRKKVEQLSFQMMKTLAATIDAKDHRKNGHSVRVARYSKMIAKRMGKTKKEQHNIYYMALLHDVGIIGVSDETVNKPGRLTQSEYDMIKKHPTIGAKILENISDMNDISVGAHWHHERFDGTGYPDNLKEYDIPEPARIIAVADAYDAMTSRRSYREMYSQEEVRREIIECMGTQFDPDIAMHMIALIDQDTDFQLREHTDPDLPS